jgi:hypothetical protein
MIYLQIAIALIVIPVIGIFYVNGVHRLGAWIIRRLPARYVRVLSKRLYITHWDKSRPYDRIGLEAEDKLNKRRPI